MPGVGVRGVGVTGGISLAARVAAMFRNSEQGVWYDPSDRATLYQDAAGTTPVTAMEQPVGLMLDKSGRGNHAYQTTSASRPVLSARVNMLTYTEDFSNAAWLKSNATVEQNAAIAPDGTVTAAVITATGSTGFARRPIAGISGVAVTGKMYLRRKTGTGAIYIYVGNGSTTEPVTSTLTSEWKLFTTTATGSVSTNNFGIQIATSGDAIEVWHPDLRPTNSGVNLPPYQRVTTSTDYDTSGYPVFLRFDGIDDFLVTNSIDFTSTDKMTLFAGVRKLSDVAEAYLLSTSANWGTNAGSFVIRAPRTSSPHYAFGYNASSTAGYDAATYSAPISNVLSVSYDGAGVTQSDKIKPRVNSATPTLTLVGTTSGTGNFGNYPLYIGARAGASNLFPGHIYSLIVRGAQSSDAQIASVERYVNSKTKAWG